MSAERSLLEAAIAGAGGPAAFAGLLRGLPRAEAERLAFEWRFLARPSQLPPAGDWRVWLALAGRGWGKTRVGAEFVRAEVEAGRAGRIALVSPTAADARDVLVEGPSGLLAISPPWFRPQYEPSKRRLTWPQGQVAMLYSADEPDRLRGPQHDLAWCDELAAYPDSEAVWTQLQFGLRVGTQPRTLATTTPRPIALLRSLVVDPAVHVTRGSTFDNAANLPGAFLEAVSRRFGGTRIGRQEIEAELLSDAPGALWQMAAIDAARVKQVPDLLRVVVGVDPAVSTSKHSNLTGIVVAGVGMCRCKGEPERHGFVLADYSGAMSPSEWARTVRTAYERHSADRVIAEKNQGGDLVEENLRANGAGNLAITTVHATRGKAIRAEPVASLYEQGKIHHAGPGLAALEDQLTQWSPLEDATSPDRLDGLVWAFTALMVDDEPIEYFPIGRPILPRRR